MRHFLVRLSWFLALVLVLLVLYTALYLKADVYNDFQTRNSYDCIYEFQEVGDLSTKKLLSGDRHYDSFILGSSRAKDVYGCYLGQRLPGACFFHYANWRETIGGIYARLRLLDSLGYSLRNVFVFLDTDYSFAEEGRCREEDHYLLTGRSPAAYRMGHYRDYLLGIDPLRLRILWKYAWQPDFRPPNPSDDRTNDFRHVCSPEVLESYGSLRDPSRHRIVVDSLVHAGFFYERKPASGVLPPMISTHEEAMLQKIALLFHKHRSNHYLILTPLYDQKKPASRDLTILHALFPGRVFDFSGVNAFTGNIYHYCPDRSHYLPAVAKAMIDSVLPPSTLLVGK